MSSSEGRLCFQHALRVRITATAHTVGDVACRQLVTFLVLFHLPNSMFLL